MGTKGMSIQCSVWNGWNGSSIYFSPLSSSALQGNQILPEVVSRMAIIDRSINGFRGTNVTVFNNDNTNEIGSPIWSDNVPATPYESYTNNLKLYGVQTLTVEYDTATKYNFVATSFLNNNFPVSDGYYNNWGDDNRFNQYGWGDYWHGNPAMPVNKQAVVISDTEIDIGLNGNYQDYTAVVTFSDLVDTGGQYDRMKSDIETHGFNSGSFTSNGKRLYYTSPYADTTTISGDGTNPYPDTFDDSVASTYSASYEPILADVAAYNGYIVSVPWTLCGFNLRLIKSQAMIKDLHSGSFPPPKQPYFIGEYKKGIVYPKWRPAITQPWVSASLAQLVEFSGSYFSSSISLIKMGMLKGNEVIGGDMSLSSSIDLPFPPSPLPTLPQVNNVPINEYYVFAVVGKTPNEWAKDNGYVIDNLYKFQGGEHDNGWDGSVYWWNNNETTLDSNGTGWFWTLHFLNGAIDFNGNGLYGDLYYSSGVLFTGLADSVWYINGEATTLDTFGSGVWDEHYYLFGNVTTLDTDGNGWWTNPVESVPTNRCYVSGAVFNGCMDDGRHFTYGVVDFDPATSTGISPCDGLFYSGGSIFTGCNSDNHYTDGVIDFSAGYSVGVSPCDGLCHNGGSLYTGYYDPYYYIEGVQTSLDSTGNGYWAGNYYINGEIDPNYN